MSEHEPKVEHDVVWCEPVTIVGISNKREAVCKYRIGIGEYYSSADETIGLFMKENDINLALPIFVIRGLIEAKVACNFYMQTIGQKEILSKMGVMEVVDGEPVESNAGSDNSQP